MASRDHGDWAGAGPAPDDGAGPAGTRSFVPGPGQERALRDALGRFATGVTVVTAPAAHAADAGAQTAPHARPMGITANSFASLSLDPPLVLWSPARASRRFTAFATADHFAIHVLAADQIGLARHFAGPGAGFDLPGIAPGIAPGLGGAPLLPGVLACFECAREAVHEGGDHAIVVGRVLRASLRDGAPLVFASGRFGGFAPLD